MLQYLRNKISQDSPIRQVYYRLVSFLAALVYRYPSRHLTVIGVTGTKGKTTTCNVIAHLLMTAGHSVGMATTVNFRIKNTVWANTKKMTTLGRFALQKLLRQMVDAGCEYAVIEVSSHAMVQQRLNGIIVDCAVLTNLQEDHLEYHGGKRAYKQAKGLLFKAIFASKRKFGVEKAIILNREDAEYAYFNEFLADKKLTFGLIKGDIRASKIEMHAHGSVFTLDLPNSSQSVYLPLAGEFNIRNALAASAVALNFGIESKMIKKGLESCCAIPGRVESIRAGQKFTVIVDYAHTEESLENLCQFFKKLTPGKLHVVFGCTGGGRDTAKRARMGAIAHKYADTLIITDDDPYFEDRYSIIDQVSQGVKRQEGKGFWKIVHRDEAIRLALTLAHENDTVLIAGKGGEEVFALDGKLLPWSDADVVRKFLTREIEVHLEDGEVMSGSNKCMAA